MAGIPLTGKITPIDATLDTYPVFEDTYGQGGFRTVQTIEDRDNITELRRKWGMFVYVIDEKVVFVLEDTGNGDITDNSNWIEFSGGGNSLGASTTFTNGNLANGRFLYTHNLNAMNNITTVTVMDNNSEKFEIDGVKYINNNTVELDLRSLEPIDGTWTVFVTCIRN